MLFIEIFSLVSRRSNPFWLMTLKLSVHLCDIYFMSLDLFHQLFSLHCPVSGHHFAPEVLLCSCDLCLWICIVALILLWEMIAFALKSHITRTFLKVVLFFANKATKLPNLASVGPTYSLFLEMVCFLARMHINLRQVELFVSGHL